MTLQAIREFAARRDWSGLVAATRAVPAEALLQEPEAALYCADALRRVGETAAALELARRADVRVRQCGDGRLRRRILNVLGMTLFESGQIDEAENSFGELLSAAAEAEDAEFAARASNNLGVLANIRGDGALALTCYERALAAYQRLGQLRGLAQTHHNLGISYRDLGRIEEADAHYLRAIDYAGRAESEDVIALAETERAVVRIRSGDAPMAEQFALRALARFERLGDPVRSAEAERVLAGAARASGRLEIARDRLARAFTVAQLHANLLLRAEVQRDRGELLHQLGQPDAARAAFTDAAEHFRRLGNTVEAERVLARATSIPEGESGSEPTLNGEAK